MAKKNKNDYFEMMKRQAEYCTEASTLLEEMLCGFSFDKIPQMRDKIHSVENAADDLYHDILTKLSAEFITPIDQEDILRLVQIIDDVTDALDEVVLDFYMYNVTEVPSGADEFSRLVNKCVHALSDAISELKNFKKPETLLNLLKDVNKIEEEADITYTKSIHKLFAQCNDAKTLIGTKAVFESLETCCDLCVHAGDVIEQIIIKNT